jgi:hypothetical protein
VTPHDLARQMAVARKRAEDRARLLEFINQPAEEA